MGKGSSSNKTDGVKKTGQKTKSKKKTSKKKKIDNTPAVTSKANNYLAYKSLDLNRISDTTKQYLEKLPSSQKEYLLYFANQTSRLNTNPADVQISQLPLYGYPEGLIDALYDLTGNVAFKQNDLPDVNTDDQITVTEAKSGVVAASREKSSNNAIELSRISESAPYTVEPPSGYIEGDVVDASNFPTTFDSESQKYRNPAAIYNTNEATSTNEVAMATAPNLNKAAADKERANQYAIETLEVGTEYRNEILQKNVLGEMVDNIKKHILGHDPSGDMHRNFYATFKTVDVASLFGFRRAHIFMTTPNCNIFKPGTVFSRDGITMISKTRGEWRNDLNPDIVENAPDLCNAILDGNIDVAMYLDSETYFGQRRNVWCYPMMNKAKSFSGLPNYDLRTRQGPSNFFGDYIEMVVGVNGLSGNSLNITFEDDKEVTISRMMLVYRLYMEAIGMGLIQGRNARDKEIDYMQNIFLFITDETNRQLKYYFQFVGSFPKSTSYDHLSISFPSINDRGMIYIPFKLTVPIDMQPTILATFNQITAKQDDDSDRKMILNPSGNTNNYNYSTANVSGVSAISSQLPSGYILDQSSYYSDMFFITSERPIYNPKTGKYMITQKKKLDERVLDHGKIKYYLMFANRHNTIKVYEPDSNINSPNPKTSAPQFDYIGTRKNILELAKQVSVIEGNRDNVNTQVTLSEIEGGIDGVDKVNRTYNYMSYYEPSKSIKSRLL